MAASYQGASGPSGYAGLLPPPGQPAGRNHATPGPALMRFEQPSQERLVFNQIRKLTDAFLEHDKESSVTKEMIVALLEHLDRLGVGMSSRDVIQETTRSHTLLSALKWIESKLQDVSDRFKDAGYVGSDEDSKAVSELVDYIRNVVNDYRHPISKSSTPGEPPPPPLRACFGRDELIEEIVGLTENLTPIALIGPGGIGKTSIALTVLHHGRVKERFGADRRFIRCDQFPASHAHLLSRISKVIGAGVENPEDLTPLQPFLSSREMILILDNAESILDPQGTSAQEIYAVVEELSLFSNICLCITSRISTIPPACDTLDVPTLSMEAARSAFYHIYKNGGWSGLVDGILEQLEFHPLSITLLATVAHHSKWDADRLGREWKRQRTGVLRTRHNASLAATIELSLTSPMFRELGPDGRELLGVIAFFPQGVDERNLDWLFPTLPNRTDVFDDFCILSLTYRSNGFVTMLAPLRDYLCPRDPASSSLLCATKDLYFRRLSVRFDPNEPGFGETRWITSEDVNVEHLLDVFTSTDVSSPGVWDACSIFLEHLKWHKPRLVTLGPKITGLPDDHPSKPQCLAELSTLFSSVGNHVEFKRLLICSLEIWRQQGNDLKVAEALWRISKANRLLGLRREGIQQAKEALGIFERLDHRMGQAGSLGELAELLFDDKQLDAAEEAASRAIDLSYEGNQFEVCRSCQILGGICHSRGETEKAIHHFGVAISIASFFNWRDHLFWTHHSLALLFFDENRFDEAHAHAERAKSHATNDPYMLGGAMKLQTKVWYRQRMFKEARSEVLRALDIYERIGALKDVEDCRLFLREIEKAASREMDSHTQGSGHNPTGSSERKSPRTTYPAPGRISNS